LNINIEKEVIKFVFQISILLGLMLGCAPAGNQAGPSLNPTTPATATSTVAPATATAPAEAISQAPTATPEPAATASPTAAIPTEIAALITALPTAIPTEIAALVTALPSPTAGPPAQTSAEDPVAYGLQVYREQYCGICHRLDAAGTAGVFGPEQNNIGRVAEQRIQAEAYQGEATTAAEYIRESILNPSIYLAEGYEQSRHHMPPFTHLSQDQVDALVAMLLQQRQEGDE
jgi:mono/diheme cytochrome c family protein